jgi:hypothetical protein
MSARVVCLACLAAIGGISPAWGHDPGEVLDMQLEGAISPFGVTTNNNYTEVWGAGDYAYIGSLSSGVAIIDASDRQSLRYRTTFAPTAGREFHDIRVYGDVGFFSSNNGGGTFVVDLSAPTTPTMVTQIDSSIGGFENVRNAAFDSGLLYQIDTASSRVAVFDVTDPAAPQLVRQIETGDSVGLFDVTIEGGRMYVTGKGGVEGEGAVYIYDISEVATSGESFITQIPAGPDVATAWPIHGGTQVLTTDLKFAGNLSLWDLSELADPDLVLFASAGILNLNSYSTAGLVVLNDSAYVPWFQAGTQLIDLDTMSSSGGFLRIGQYATAPGISPLAGFIGSTSVFAGQGHDQLLLSDTKFGLFAVDASQIVFPLDIPGDYNVDGVVDIDDLELWRATFGSAINLAADGNRDGVVDSADYTIWRDAFVDNRLQLSSSLAGANLAVPEPTGWVLLCGLALLLCRFRAP